MVDPLISSGTPITATSDTLPVPVSRVSISNGPVRLPETLIVSSLRPSSNSQRENMCMAWLSAR